MHDLSGHVIPRGRCSFGEGGGRCAIVSSLRQLFLSYERRNDFFATHPGNVQRAMAYRGTDVPYMFNLVDQHRYQEDFNDGYSYCHVFVGAGWLAPNHNVPDPEELSKGLYRDFLAYFAELRAQGQLVDMTMGEFAAWYRQHMPIGRPQVALAKDVLYNSGKHYFWYIDPYMRVTVDATQGGSIGDLRPYAGQVACVTGPDTPHLIYGSYPYLIHSQYRSGYAHHFADGARTTLRVSYRGETVDLCACRTRVAGVTRDAQGTHVRLTPAEVAFSSGLTAAIETTYHFVGGRKVVIARRLAAASDPAAALQMEEYLKGCYGVTEYPQDMHGIVLAVEGDNPQTLPYAYRSRVIRTANAHAVRATVPQVNTRVSLEALDGPATVGQAVEGYLFNPYYTLTLEKTLKVGEEMRTCLNVQKC